MGALGGIKGLGTYTIQPTLTGEISVHHSDKAMSRVFDDEPAFKHDLQKHDWPLFYKACKDLLVIVDVIFNGGYFKNNVGNQLTIIKTAKTAIEGISKMRPLEMAREIKFIIDMFPLFARTPQYQYNKRVKDNIAVLAEYYRRYLQRYETYENSFLTA